MERDAQLARVGAGLVAVGARRGMTQWASPFAYPCITSSSAAVSATVRPIGPLIEKNCSGPGEGETRPREGFSPNVPHHDDGLRIDPPPSEPCEIGQSPATIADAAPPDDPPQLRSRFQGLRPGRVRGGFAHVERPELGRHGLAEDREARSADASHQLVVTLGDAVGPQLRAVRGADARGVVQVLDRDRDTAEVRHVFAAAECLLGPRGGVERVLGRHGDVRAESWVDALDALEVQLR